MTKICNIEFNEANFEFIKCYLDTAPKMKWPNLRRVLSLTSISTKSEDSYELLEPWIQWASLHTGQTAAEHGIFRLGDINHSSSEQIFEWAEKKGISVGNISSMNVANRLKAPKFFIPDPWTVTPTDGSFFSTAIYDALFQSVNDNSAGKLTRKTVATLLLALLFKTKKRNWLLYLKLVVASFKGKKWNKALFLDLFISDLHLNYSKKNQPQFTSVFFNAFAHIQHHYLFNSKFYVGDFKNPSWYISSDDDPLVDALDVYDRIFADQLNFFKNYEILIMTGLRQVPYTQMKHYYRLENHSEFLRKLGIVNARVFPRMTRDFLIEFDSIEACNEALVLLSSVELCGKRVFGTIDDRGSSLFVTLTYPDKISDDEYLSFSEREAFAKAADEFVFVAIKNGMHDGLGYAFTSHDNEEFSSYDGRHIASLNKYLKDRLLDC